ncbi:hypothetical protein GCM10011585_12560 [Edaphobacter dinghuensis]|uniref:Uncharacterized protein n=1 Tax=Edaphobacter dinghuensis TaxID=1560005 RepID=A0A917M304_9BACT|nr:hypothetical protein GCM10011585_12560 [Edaphobacter dinghuensis]
MIEALAFEPSPGPGGIDDFEMATPLEFAREFEVMKDAKDSLNNSHEGSGGGLNR